ncbi:MAG TPA: hypothetical protein VN721_06685 [Flavipsychrobacter sp.]|nr:hypothetical protein [Flavipsychrobacter sp.]
MEFTFLNSAKNAFVNDFKSLGKAETYSNALDLFDLMAVPDVSSHMSENDQLRYQVIQSTIKQVKNIPNWGSSDWGAFTGHVAFAMALTKGSSGVAAIFREAIPKFGTLSDLGARQWYLTQETKIPGLIDKTASLETQAKQAHLEQQPEN